jgi:hypothetical protein
MPGMLAKAALSDKAPAVRISNHRADGCHAARGRLKAAEAPN